MGLLSWMKGRAERKASGGGSVTVYDNFAGLESYLLGISSYASKSGARVTYETALRAATALACTRVIADDLAKLPFKVFRRDGANRTVAEDHPLYDLLYTAPNEFQTAPEMMQQIAAHFVLAGDAFVWKNRNRGRVVELIPFEPQFVTVERNGWELTYTINTDQGNSYRLPADDVWHLRNLSWNGYLGLDGVSLAREAIGLAMATEEHGAKLFANGATLGGALTLEASLTPEAIRDLRDSFNARHAGSGNAFGVAVLPAGVKWQQMGNPNDQVQLLETRAFQVEQICSAMGVLPIMVGHSDKAATYASAEAMFQTHQTKTMQPKYRFFEASANKNLLSKQERRDGYYCKFVVNALMHATAKDRIEYLYKKWSMGAATANEIREFDEENPYPGGEKHYRPANMAEINPAGPDLPLAASGASDNGEENGQAQA